MTLQPHKKRGRIVGEEPVRRRNFFDLSFGDHRSYCALLACQFPVEANRHHCCLNHLQIASQLSESSLSYHLRNGFFDNKQRDSCCTSLVLLKNRKIETGVPTLDNNSDIFREYPWLQTETFSLPNPRPEKFCWIFFKKKPDLYHSLDSETKLSWRLTPHKDLICENETIVNASLNLRYPTEQAKALKDLQEGNWTFNHYQLNSVSLYCLSFLKKKLGEEKRIAGDRDGIEVKESSPQNQTGSSSTSQKKTTTSGGTGSSIIPVHGGGKQYDTNASRFPLLKAPSVVFIDELDAVGRERGLIKGSGGQERDATLNQLLVSLDGFEGRGEAITIASTNRPDILDPALVRPGRFDRKIFIPKPGLNGTMEILQVRARKKLIAEDLDYMAVASMTDGIVGAELANIVEIAAINMMRDGRTELTTDDLLQAAQIEERGMLDRKDRSSETWRQVAINEAAIAVVAVNFPDLKNIEFLTINPRAGRELGYVRVKMDHIKFKEGMLSRQPLLDHITVQLAPRAADELWYGENQLSTIWAETSDNARSAARSLVHGGLSEKHHGLDNFWDIDLEALRILNMCYERAKEILQKNRTLMDEVVEKLVQKKSLSKQEFFTLVELYGSIKPMPPRLLELTKIKRLQL